MTFDMDLIEFFESRGKFVDRLDVEEGATLYKIKVKRPEDVVEEHIEEMEEFLEGKDHAMP